MFHYWSEFNFGIGENKGVTFIGCMLSEDDVSYVSRTTVQKLQHRECHSARRFKVEFSVDASNFTKKYKEA
ncbi:hypothetical protein M422DRAFT_780699, partial [Sphaerobolus stellatus SS14]